MDCGLWTCSGGWEKSGSETRAVVCAAAFDLFPRLIGGQSFGTPCCIRPLSAGPESAFIDRRANEWPDGRRLRSPSPQKDDDSTSALFNVQGRGLSPHLYAYHSTQYVD